MIHFRGLYDDIYVDIVFVNVFDRLGLEAPPILLPFRLLMLDFLCGMPTKLRSIILSKALCPPCPDTG